MATLEDAAEELVVRLKGLDVEIEQSRGRLDDLEHRIESASRQVAAEWTVLVAAATSCLEKVREQQERLGQSTEETLQALGQAQKTVHENGAEARSAIAEGRAWLEGLTRHAAALEPGVESLVVEAGEAPARSLAERAAGIEQELARVAEQARSFLRDEVAPGLEQSAADLRERCEALKSELAEEHTAALEEVFAEWESRVDELEQHVATEAFRSSQQHVHDVVAFALDECGEDCGEQIGVLCGLAAALDGQLQALLAELQRAFETAAQGAELNGALDATNDAASAALAALGRVRGLLASYRFVEI